MMAALASVPAQLVTAGAVAAQEADPVVDSALFQDMQWRSIGPFRGGRSVAATGVASDPMTYYFGGVGSGVWKTDDAGVTWTNVTDGHIATSSVGAIAVAESDPNVVYVGMGEHAIRGVMTSHGDGVYRSTDAGRNWTHMGLDRTRSISRIRIHPKDPDLVYVAAQGAPYGANEERGVYRSRDGGSTWELILYVDENSGASDLSMDMTNPRILYAASWEHRRLPWQVQSGGPGSGFWKSVDGGDSWEKLEDGFPELMGKTAIDVSRANPDRVFAMVEADPDGGVYRSDDAGATWEVVSEDWTLRARAWYYIEVFADPLDEETVYVLNAPAMKSVDGGRNFTRVSVPHGDNHDLWINPYDNEVMINSNDGGANVSFNAGESWSTQRNQPTAQFYRVNVDNRFPYRVYGGQQDNSSVAIASFGSGGITWKERGDHLEGLVSRGWVRERLHGLRSGRSPLRLRRLLHGHHLRVRPSHRRIPRHRRISGPSSRAPGQGDEVPLQLERAHRGFTARSFGRIPRVQRSRAHAGSGDELGGDQPRPDPGRG